MRLSTCALNAEAAQRAFELGYTSSDSLEVLFGEREKPHRGTRHDCGRPLSSQKECNLTERVAGAEGSGLATVAHDIGAALFDQIEGRSVVVERDDLGTPLNLDLVHGRRKLVELRRRKIRKEQKCCDPARIHGRDRATGSNRLPIKLENGVRPTDGYSLLHLVLDEIEIQLG
jgi:hypothetical protein